MAPTLNPVELHDGLWSFRTGNSESVQLCPVCKVGGKPLIHSTTDSNAIQKIHEGLKGYSIKGCTEVKEEDDRE